MKKSKTKIPKQKQQVKKPGMKIDPAIMMFGIVTVVLALVICLLFAIEEGIVALEGHKRTVDNEVKRYQYKELLIRAGELHDAADRLKVGNYTKDQASFNLLTKADYLHERYGADLSADVLNYSNDVASAEMKVRYFPKSAEDFIEMISYISTQREPTIYIQDVSVGVAPEAKDVYEVSMILLLEHPFTEGNK